jgi:hypothetical protein
MEELFRHTAGQVYEVWYGGARVYAAFERPCLRLGPHRYHWNGTEFVGPERITDLGLNNDLVQF